MKRIAVLLFVCWASYAQYVPPAGSGGGGGGSGTVTHTPGALTANQLAIGNGSADITVLGSLGTTSTVLHGNAAGAPSYAAVALGTEVSGTLLAAQFPALTGDVTTTAGSLATTIGAARVTNAMLAGSIAASNLIGSDITTVGTIATGTWQATKLGLTYGGTNADLSATGGTSQVLKQITLGGAITVARLACADLSNAATTCSSATAGTPPFSAITAGTNAAALLIGTGGSLATSGSGTIAATSVTNLTLANTLTTSGNFPLTLTTTASTNVTLPTTGTLATLAGTETLSAKTLTAPIVGVFKPVSDSATAITTTKADGTTAVVTVDTTNKRLLVGDLTNASTVLLDGPGRLICFVTFGSGLCANNNAIGYNPGFYTNHLLAPDSIQVDAAHGLSVGINSGNAGFEVTGAGSVAMNGPVGIGPLNYTSLTSTLNVTDKTATTGATRFVIGLGAADSTTTVTSSNAGTTKAAGYQSSDGSPGVTGATCTSFKNGLCVTL